MWRLLVLFVLAGSMAGRAAVVNGPRLSVPAVFLESGRMSVMVWTTPQTNVHLEEWVNGEWIEIAFADYVYDPPICFSMELSAAGIRILRAWCEPSLDTRFNPDWPY
jgi:hypothetical protein